MADVSTLVIEELAGQKRRLDLRGPSLPFMGASWKTHQQVVTTWNQGNAIEATQQVLGGQFVPSEWEGHWSRVLLGRVPALYSEGGVISQTNIVEPATLREVFESINLSGIRLRVRWVSMTSAGAIRTIVREGRLTDFEANIDRITDIAWKMSFDWVGQGQSLQKVVATRAADRAAKANELAETTNLLAGYAALQKWISSNPRLPGSTKKGLIGQLQKLAAAPNAILEDVGRSMQRLTTQLSDLGDAIAAGRSVPAQLQGTGLQIARNTLAQVQKFRDDLTARPAELNTRDLELAAYTRAQRHFWGADVQARSVARKSVELTLSVSNPKLRSTQNTSDQQRMVLAVHRVKEGETLPTISRDFYGTAEHAVDIARANHLVPWQVRMPIGVAIIIPVLNQDSGTTFAPSGT